MERAKVICTFYLNNILKMMLMKNVLLSSSFQNKSKSDEMLIISLGSFGSLNNYNMVIDMKKVLRYNTYIFDHEW